MTKLKSWAFESAQEELEHSMALKRKTNKTRRPIKLQSYLAAYVQYIPIVFNVDIVSSSASPLQV